MTKWFGDSWGAPVCEPDEHVETPVGRRCFGHDHMHAKRIELIEEDDQGVMIPFLSFDGPTTIAYHLDCWLHEVGADRL
jgi:hypothetical protein